MRIISGELGGRQFSSPKSQKTHPMSEKVRGAIFNTLGDIRVLTVLDAFAGSGALSFEAISRGARRVIAIDNDKSAQKVIASNIKNLGLGAEITLIRASADAWLTTSSDRFDLILLDPPYDEVRSKVLNELANRVKPAGVIVLSLPKGSDFALQADEFRLISAKDYGDAKLVFYKRVDLSS